MNGTELFLQKKLSQRDSQGLLRKLDHADIHATDFSSNDYLGLARSEGLFQHICESTNNLAIKWNGSTGSRLLSGNSRYTEETEQHLAGIFRSDAALIFNSGYAANLAVLSSLPQRNDTIIYDDLAHACMKDGARLSLARRMSFRHNDLSDLESKIKRSSGNIFIAVESVYSMDGDECPLHELTALAEKYNANIILDEAHSTGVRGDHGSGLAVSLGLHKNILARIYTFGKAMGVHGACVAGSDLIKQYLINFARPFIYTTAMPPHAIVSIRCAFDYLQQHIELQQDLEGKIRLYLQHISGLSNRTDSVSSIQTFFFAGNENSKMTAQKLRNHGFDVRAILSPTVPAGSERLRICLHAFNTHEQILDLTRLLKELSSHNSND